jgi:hypothetical protein
MQPQPKPQSPTTGSAPALPLQQQQQQQHASGDLTAAAPQLSTMRLDDVCTPGSRWGVVPAHGDPLRHALLSFFICYAPHRLPEVPALIERHEAEADEAEEIRRTDGDHIPMNLGGQMRHIVLRYKDEFSQTPAEGEVLHVVRKDERTRLLCYFASRSTTRSKMEEVDALLGKYHACMPQLWQALEARYGAEMPPFDLFSEDGDDVLHDLAATQRRTVGADVDDLDLLLDEAPVPQKKGRKRGESKNGASLYGQDYHLKKTVGEDEEEDDDDDDGVAAEEAVLLKLLASAGVNMARLPVAMSAKSRTGVDYTATEIDKESLALL